MNNDNAWLLQIGLGLLVVLFFFARRWLKPEENNFATFVSLGISVFLLFAFATAIRSLGVYAAPAAAGLGIILAAIWATSLGQIVARPFTSILDGGDTQPELRPLYSMAQAKRQRGKYDEAIAQIHTQLERFPEDFQGWLLLAEIYADDLKDLEQARTAIHEILSHRDHTPKNIAYALTRLADWHLSLAQDRLSAQALLKEIVRRFPETEHAHNAEQRLAHLASEEMLAAAVERPRIEVKEYHEKIGLLGQTADPRKPEPGGSEKAVALVAHLSEHPGDWEAREDLARLYASHYQRLDLATDQLETLVKTPNVPQKNVAHWLNLMADLYIDAGDPAAARITLQRIIDTFPKTAIAATAEKRIAYLSLEGRKNTKSQVLQLGSYEENIGLKGQVPKL